VAEPNRFVFAAPVLPSTVEQARADQIKAVKFGLLVSLAPAALVVALSPIVPVALSTGASVFSGVHFEPHGGGGVSARMTAAAAALYLLPIPAGVVPPERYGIDPSIVPHTVGTFPGQKTLGFAASEPRQASFDARERERLIIGYLRRGAEGQALGDIATERLVADLLFLRATSHQETASVNALAILERRVPERLADDRANGVPLPAPVAVAQIPLPQFAVPQKNPAPVPVSSVEPVGTFNPSSIRPIRLTAMAAIAAHEFLRKELLTERADP